MDDSGSGLIGILAVLFGGGFLLFMFVMAIVVIASLWKIFAKAGKPGWASIVPIYNAIVLFEIVGRPAWWILLFLIPFVNFVIAIIVAVDLAKSFGKGGGFAVGLLLLGFIFYPILGFGSARYLGPAAAGQALAAGSGA
jgi:hypothetical protein